MQHTIPETTGMAQQLSLRVPDETMERGNRLAERLATLPEYQGFPVSRSRVLTQALLRGLDLLEQEHGLAKKKRSK